MVDVHIPYMNNCCMQWAHFIISTLETCSDDTHQKLEHALHSQLYPKDTCAGHLVKITGMKTLNGKKNFFWHFSYVAYN